jgi:MoaA/NifB/PqqE/SkfB family radical SAM enzyme
MKINKHQFSLDTTERDRLWEERRRNFTDYCVNRFQWHSYPKWSYVAPFPLHVDFEASFRCNLKCPMCFRPHLDRKDYGDMDFALYKKGIDECADNGLYSIRLSWRGEPTMNPRLPEMVAYAKERGVKEVSFITNGTNLTDDLSRSLIQAGLDYVTVSVDGLKHHYDAIRKPSTYEGVTERIAALYCLKESLGGGYPRIKVQGIWRYLEEDPASFYDHFKDITDHVDYDPYHDYSTTNYKQDEMAICQYPWQRITITWTGEIPLCITDWNMAQPIGDLRTQSITEVWRGEAMNRYRALQLEHRRMEIAACRRCYRHAVPQLGNLRQGRVKDSGQEVA